MSIVERLYAPTLGHPSPDASTAAPANKDHAIALGRGAVADSFFWPMQLLPAQRREAMYALYAFCSEVDDIADGEASRSLKEILLLNWRSEIAHLYAGRPRNTVTLGLNKAIHLYGLRCDDFLAIIDGAEMDARTDIRAPSLAQLDRYSSARRSRSAGSRYASSAKNRRRASGLRQNSAGRCSSPTYCAISPKMPSDSGSICQASCCTRTAYSPPSRAGCWRSQRFPLSAASWRRLPNAITRLPQRQLPSALAGRCAQRP